jgi:hypothetical protein
LEYLVEEFTLIQGDSSDVSVFSSTDFDTFDNNWSATMAIVDTLGGTTIISRAVPKNDGTDGNPVNSRFILQILPSESDLLTPGNKYFLVMEVKNDVLNFKNEIVQTKFKVTAGGIA